MAEDVFGIVGTVVGGAFNVEAVVAEGGFAVVYRAYHGAFHAPVALKCLKVPNVGRADQKEFLERFREEGEVLFRLSMSIPAVVRPLHVDAFETDRGVFVPYMALEWLDGETLDVQVARRVQEGRPPMSPKRVVRLLTSVARALDRAHKFPGPDGPVSIVHRDLKPDNIVIATINGEEVVKILDFGIAKVKSAVGQVAGRLSQSAGSAGAVPFTPGYAAPEQWFPKRYGQTGPWTDVWGLALTCVEAMAGKAVIDGDHAAMMGTAIDEKRRPTPRNEGVDVSDAVEKVFLKALAVDPRDRYADAGEFWDELEEALGMPRSRALYVGNTPQPLLDPRSEGGAPAVLEERIEAVESRRSPRVLKFAVAAPTSSRQGGATLDEVPSSRADSKADVGVSDLGLSRPQRPERPDSNPAIQVPDFDLGAGPQLAPPSTPAVTREPSNGRQAPPAEPSIPGLTSNLNLAESSMKLSVPIQAEASGIDLAVSTAEVRRTSTAQMRAMRVPPPSSLVASTPRASGRSGTHRATSAASHARAVEVARPRKIGLPIGLVSLGVAISIAHYVNTSMGGARWALGPVQVNWIAGLLVVGGTAMLLIRLFWQHMED